MGEDAGDRHAAVGARAGFWRRLVALGIDLLLVNLLVVVTGLALTGLTGGKVRIAGSTIVDAVDCTATGPVPRGFLDITLNCRRSVLGLAHDWTLEKMTRGADGQHDFRVETPLDAQGNQVRAFYIDDLIPFVLAAYFLLLEWCFGTTPGKRITGVGVRSLGGGPMDLVQAGKRMLVRFMVLVCAGDVSLLSFRTSFIDPPSAEAHRFVAGLTLSPRTADLGMMSQALNVLVVAYFVGFLVTTARRKRPLHDWWAGMEAVRLPFKKEDVGAPIAV